MIGARPASAGVAEANPVVAAARGGVRDPAAGDGDRDLPQSTRRRPTAGSRTAAASPARTQAVRMARDDPAAVEEATRWTIRAAEGAVVDPVRAPRPAGTVVPGARRVGDPRHLPARREGREEARQVAPSTCVRGRGGSSAWWPAPPAGSSTARDGGRDRGRAPRDPSRRPAATPARVQEVPHGPVAAQARDERGREEGPGHEPARLVADLVPDQRAQLLRREHLGCRRSSSTERCCGPASRSTGGTRSGR